MSPPFDHSYLLTDTNQTHTTMNEDTNKQVLKVEPMGENFIKNGGILLQKRISLSNGQEAESSQVKILSAKEIQVGINQYNPNLIIGRCRTRIIYNGVLEEHVVAISCPRDLNPNHLLIDLWLTELATLMVMNHVNIVKLYGCCLETYIPIIVFEYLPNHSLYEHLHGPLATNNCLKWAERLNVAIGLAYALSYLHNAFSNNTIVHRAIQSNSIFLDSSFCTKLANFSHCVAVTPGDNCRKWPVQGTPGYVDPDYVETQEVTDKCDVYSFGVLMLELLTRRHPIKMAINGRSLVDDFTLAMENGSWMEIMDSVVLIQASSNEINQFAQIALTCVAKKGVERPSMIEVVRKLWVIRDQHRQ